VKILHLSDLHFVATETRDCLTRASDAFSEVDIELSADSVAAEGQDLLLTCLIERYGGQLDAILVTGDLTGVGDDASLSLASSFLRTLAEHTIRSNLPDADRLRRVFVLPGNHDVLLWSLYALSRAIRKGPPLLRLAGRLPFVWPAKFLTRFQSLLTDLGLADRMTLGSNRVEDFRRFLESGFNVRLADFSVSARPGIDTVLLDGEAKDGQPVRVQIAMISTVTLTPYLFSAGMVGEADAAELSLTLERAERTKAITIAATHQGFMPTLPLFISGESESACLDFELGKEGALYTFGAAAGGRISGDFGYTLLSFRDRDLLDVSQFSYDARTASFEETNRHPLGLGNQAPRLTRISRNEVHEIFYDDSTHESLGRDQLMDRSEFESSCRELFRTSSNELLYFGLGLRQVRTDILSRLTSPKKVDRDACVARLLMGVRFLLSSTSELFGSGPFSLDAVAKKWEDFLTSVVRHTSLDEVEVRKFLQVRVTTTPLSSSGLAEYKVDALGNRSFMRALVRTNDFAPRTNSHVYLDVRPSVTSGLVQHFAGTAVQRWDEGKPLW
jgi:hypothetical protein